MRQQWTDYWMFLREFRRTFESTGAVLPSGQALSAALARYVRDGAPQQVGKTTTPRLIPAGEGENSGRRILEVGPGTGAVTHHILRAMRDSDRLDLVERNDEFVARLRERLASEPAYRAFADRIMLHHASVEDLAENRPYDVIVSGLPLNNFSVELVERILAKLGRLLAPGGTLSFFEYVAIRKAKAMLSRQSERKRLAGIGRLLGELLAHEVHRDRVWTNVPPAWVHHVRGIAVRY